MASLEFIACKGTLFKLNIFSTELALIITLIGMIVMFVANLVQCFFNKRPIFRQNSSQSPANHGPDSRNEENQRQISKPSALMPDTNFRSYFPERENYKEQFMNLQPCSSKGLIYFDKFSCLTFVFLKH